MSKVALHTLGCKLNFSETSAVGEQFMSRGFGVVEFDEIADVYIINTCTVTENADRECRQIVRRALRQNPDAFIIVTGCYAQLRAGEIAAIEGVDAVLGSNEKFKIFELFNDFEKQELSCIYTTPTNKLEEFNSAYSTDADNRTRAFLKVQDGCDYKCSFCTIPQARGKSRSAPVEEVVDNFKTLLDNGYKEIILTGVNVGDYNYNGINLFNLLKSILMVEGDYRIRISSIEPNLLTDEIINLVSDDPRMCNHFHIPLQSGSAEILKQMQRRYKRSDYENLIRKIVTKINDVGIGVDVIVGFPGETDEHFNETYNFLKELPIYYLHVFTYSERPDTKAIDLPGTVDFAVRKKRNNMLRILSAKKRSEFNRQMVGNKLNVLFEHQEQNGIMKGFASNYVRVKSTFNPKMVNKFSPVDIAGADGEICFTEIKNDIKKITNLAG